MRSPRHITLVPILCGMVTFGLLGVVFVSFFLGSWLTEDRTHSRVYWFRTSDSGEIEAYLTHSVDDRFWGFRVEQLPVAVVEIRSKDTMYAPPGRHGRGRAPIVRTAYEDSFTIRIRDGEGDRADGGIWDFPPLDQRVAKKIEPGSIADEALKGQPDEMRAMLADILDEIPEPGDEIEASRRDALVGAVQRALREDGFGWVADGVDAGSWSRGGVDFVGVLKLVVGVVVLIGVAVVFERLSARWRRSRAS